MARLTVSVPQDLYDRLDQWRDRLNISKVCQEALAREVRRLEEVPADARALGDLVERLSQEKADGERHWFNQGVSDGMTWAQGASYVDLRSAAEKGQVATPEVASAIRRALARYADQAGFDRSGYTSGWAFAASEVWRRVETKL
jgi:hypothetical protein